MIAKKKCLAHEKDILKTKTILKIALELLLNENFVVTSHLETKCNVE